MVFIYSFSHYLFNFPLLPQLAKKTQLKRADATAKALEASLRKARQSSSHGKSTSIDDLDEEKIENCRKGGIIMGEKSMNLGIGIHRLTREERVENGKIYGKIGGQVVAEKYSRNFSLISPEGKIINTKNLTKFCRDNGLTRSNIQAVLRGERNQHKGWKRG